MSTYEQIVGLPLCGGLTALGLFLSFIVLRRRGLGSGLRVAAWSLLPLAAYLTGSVPMFWKIGVAIGDFAKGFVFSPKVWAGVALAGLTVVLLMVARPLRRRTAERGVTGGQDKQATGSAPGATRTLPAATGRQLATRPDPAPAAAAAKAPAKAPAKARRGKNADDDDDLGDVEDILRRHGIT
jgi:hypothetical protein